MTGGQVRQRRFAALRTFGAFWQREGVTPVAVEIRRMVKDGRRVIAFVGHDPDGGVVTLAYETRHAR